MKKTELLVTGPKVGRRRLPVEWRPAPHREASPADLQRAWIKTYTGRRFWPLSPRAKDLHIEDIAHALSLECRFSGHTKTFYSVAEHSCRVCLLVPFKYQMAALMHDASEAYLKDMPKPLKPHLPGYEAIEHRLMGVIAEKFHFKWPLPDCVKHADLRMLAAEGRDLMAGTPDDWSIWKEHQLDWRNLAEGIVIKPMTPEQAEKQFLQCYDMYGGE